MLQSQLIQSVRDVSGGVADVLPKIIAAIILVTLGWIFGSAVGRVVQQLVVAIKADEWLRKAGVEDALMKAGYKLNSGAFIGWLAKLFFIVIFLVVALDILGLSQVNAFLVQVLVYVPNVIVAMFMLFVASIAADILSGIVSGSSKAVGSTVAHFLGSVTRWAIWVFAVMIALSQLGIAAQYMSILFTGFVAMLALAGGLAFGLGGKDVAGEFIKEVRSEIRSGRKA